MSAAMLRLFAVGLSLCYADEVSDYLKRRDQFLQQEQSMADGASEQLTEDEQRFDKWLGSTVQSLISQYKKERLVDHFVPATYFPRVREHIENTTLYKMLRAMPKGGALHLHFESASSLEWIVQRGIDLPGCHAYWPEGNATKVPLGTLAFFNATQAKTPGFLPIPELLKRMPDFRQRLLRMLTTHQEDEKLTSPQIWQKFQDVFTRVGQFFQLRTVVEQYLAATAEEFLADGVQHVEIRINLFSDSSGDLFDLDGRVYRGAAKLDVYERVIQNLQQKHPQLSVKLIGSSFRFKRPEDLRKDLALALEVRKQRPDLLVGWDAPGEEDAGRPTLDYARQLLDIQNQSRSAGVDLPLMLHDGESDWSTTNAVDAVLLGTKRLGHGFNIVGHPLLMEEVKSKGVAIEVCPISNQVLRYISDLRLHPGQRMLQNGLPVVLSSDDPGIWGARGLSHDFWEATVAWQLNTKTLKALASNSIQFSALPNGEKEKAMSYWSQQWQHFMATWESHLVTGEIVV
ncbi:unnamed protein product [Effrenium voratum]|uniref:adenosine deaminase n=1 Tax=Effrenium voratum TaxID=2562239 RepID=A0AA36J7C3_9DINO|nr:unnamed protein product [Effrenium voratum]CAJ1431552.1 unnamed protein product [Effrenium voratum]